MGEGNNCHFVVVHIGQVRYLYLYQVWFNQVMLIVIENILMYLKEGFDVVCT